MHQLQLHGIVVSFGGDPALLLPDGRRIPFKWERNLYELLVVSAGRMIPLHASLSLANPAQDHLPEYHHWKTTTHMRGLNPRALAELWHSRLHIGTERLRATAKAASGIPEKLAVSPHVTCDCCQLATARRLPLNSTRKSPAARPGERIFCDIAGPFQTAIGGYHYFLLCVDDFTRYTWVYPMKLKSEAHGHAVRCRASGERAA